MFQTKRALKRRIIELEADLSKQQRVEQINAIVKKYDLPKCESRICRGCAYASKELTPWGQVILQGCRKDLECKDFIPETKIVFVSLESTGGREEKLMSLRVV